MVQALTKEARDEKASISRTVMSEGHTRPSAHEHHILLASGEGLSKVYPCFSKNESSLSRAFFFKLSPTTYMPSYINIHEAYSGT